MKNCILLVLSLISRRLPATKYLSLYTKKICRDCFFEALLISYAMNIYSKGGSVMR